MQARQFFNKVSNLQFILVGALVTYRDVGIFVNCPNWRLQDWRFLVCRIEPEKSRKDASNQANESWGVERRAPA